MRRLAYFDNESLFTAKKLSEWHRGGITTAALARQLRAFQNLSQKFSQSDGVSLRLLPLVVRERQLLWRQNDGTLFTSHQQQIFNFAETNDKLNNGEWLAENLLCGQTNSQFDSAYEPHSHDAEGLRAAAWQAEEDGRLHNAIYWYRASLAAGGLDAETSFQVAELLYRLGDLSAARERYLVAIELDENYVEARANLGCVFAELGDFELAAAALEGALKFHPDYTEAHCALAETLEKLGLTEAAAHHRARYQELTAPLDSIIDLL